MKVGDGQEIVMYRHYTYKLALIARSSRYEFSFIYKLIDNGVQHSVDSYNSFSTDCTYSDIVLGVLLENW